MLKYYLTPKAEETAGEDRSAGQDNKIKSKNY